MDSNSMSDNSMGNNAAGSSAENAAGSPTGSPTGNASGGQENPNSAYLCFLTVVKFLGLQMPPEIAQKLQTGGDLYSEIIASAKKMKLKVVAGKLPARKLIDTGVPIIAKRKDGNFMLLLGKKKSTEFFFDAFSGI